MDHATSTPQLSRRKACDLCRLKKIKCDMLKPTCSNCVLYKADCRFTPLRLAKSARRLQARPDEQHRPPANVPSSTTTLHARIATLEAELLSLKRQVSSNDPQFSKIVEDLSAPLEAPTIPADVDYLPYFDYDYDYRSSSLVVPTELPLPPMHEILPFVEEYFINFNSTIPLFHQPTFMKRLHQWYQIPSQQNTASWAAINVVAALGCRTRAMSKCLGPSENQKVSQFLNNSQSVLNELVTREEDLTGIQVVLGLSLLYLGTPDTRPTTIFIATAIRLAHRHYLHTRANPRGFSPVEVTQRERLFWIAYMLDKDISLRIKQPSIQLDDDIDIQMPVQDPEDGAGYLYTLDGRAKINYFRLRIQLAQIQGLIYDSLYSVRASRATVESQLNTVIALDGLLENWINSVPSEFSPENVKKNTSSMALIHITTLYFAYFHSLTMIHSMWGHEQTWLKNIINYTQNTVPAPLGTLQPLTISNWEKVIDLTRDYMGLFHLIPQGDYACLWLNACAYFSALVILEVNAWENAHRRKALLDRDLIEFGLNLLEDLSNKLGHERLKQAYLLCVGMDISAKAAVTSDTASVAVSLKASA